MCLAKDSWSSDAAYCDTMRANFWGNKLHILDHHAEQQCILGNYFHTFASTADHMTNTGALKVNEHLQVEGFSNVFAIGDCNNISEAKTAYNAELHAGVAVGNISNSVNGKQLTAYRTGTHAMLQMELWLQHIYVGLNQLSG